jgi:GT2 family glycosyltransferase
MKERIWAVVVVYYPEPDNFKRLLTALSEQTYPLDGILIVDNGVPYNLYKLVLPVINTMIARMPRNIGSAGGFAYGMQKAYEGGIDRVWLFDEDAYPDKYCLEYMLYKAGVDIRVPIFYDPVTFDNTKEFYMKIGPLHNYYACYPTSADLTSNNGLLIHRDIITKIGVHNHKYIIGHEDFEYCLRAQKAGYKLKVVCSAVAYHPKSPKHIKTYFNMYPLRQYIPNTWMTISSNPFRERLGIRNYIWMSKIYKPRYILFIELAISMLMLSIHKLNNPKIQYKETLKLYWKTYWRK